MPMVFYNIQGDEGEDNRHPNAYNYEGSRRRDDIVEAFPIPGVFHFRFRSPDAKNSWVWVDVDDGKAKVPMFHGNVFMKALRLDTMKVEDAEYNQLAHAARVGQAYGEEEEEEEEEETHQVEEVRVRRKSSKQQRKRPQVIEEDEGPGMGGGDDSDHDFGDLMGGGGGGDDDDDGDHDFGDFMGGYGGGDDLGAGLGDLVIGPIELPDDHGSKSAEVQEAVLARAKELAMKQAIAKKEFVAEEAAKKKDAEARHEASKQKGDVLDKWSKNMGGEIKPIRNLLSTLHTVLWEGSKWKEASMTQLLTPAGVKKSYFKAMRVVHPDKLKKSSTPEQKVIAERCFEAINHAWKEFEKKEM